MERPDAVRHFIFVFSDSAHLREGFRNYSVPTRHNCDCDGRCNPTAARTTVDAPEDPSAVGAEEVVSPCQSRLAEIALLNLCHQLQASVTAPQRMWSNWMRCSCQTTIESIFSPRRYCAAPWRRQ